MCWIFIAMTVYLSRIKSKRNEFYFLSRDTQAVHKYLHLHYKYQVIINRFQRSVDEFTEFFAVGSYNFTCCFLGQVTYNTSVWMDMQ